MNRLTRALRKATQVSIRVAPTEIALRRPQRWEEDSEGGRRRRAGSDLTLPLQKFSLDQARDSFSQVPEGDRVLGRYYLTGRHDADVRQGDYWIENGLRYEVQFVHTDLSFETLAEVVVRSGG